MSYPKCIQIIPALFVIGVSLFLGACQRQSHDTANTTLRLNLGAEPSVLNPILSTDSASSMVNGLVFNGLMKVNQALAFEVDLAESYTVSPDGKTYTFKLKRTINWHDGTPFTAQDVIFTFEKILDKSTNTVRRGNYIINGKPIQIKAIDTYTVEFKLPQAFAPFISNMGMGIIPKHLYEGKDINTHPNNRNPIGTGPFILETWKPSQYIMLKRNPDYFTPVKLSKIHLKIIPDERTALIALENNELDQSGIPHKDLPRFQDHSDIRIFQYEDLLYTYLGFNLKHPFFADLRVRQAIAHAINKQAIIDGVLKGHGKLADLPVSPLSWAYPNPNPFSGYPYDLKKSKALLTSAGFTLNESTQILEKDGKPFSFTLITNKGNKDREKTAQIIQMALKQVGIDMKIQLMEWSSFIKIVNTPIDPKPFDAVILGWSLGIDPDAHSIWHSSQYPAGFNLGAYHNPTVDALIDQGRLLTKESDRQAVYAQLYPQIAQDLPYVFLYYPDVITGIHKRVTGLAKPGPAGLFNPIEDIDITP